MVLYRVLIFTGLLFAAALLPPLALAISLLPVFLFRWFFEAVIVAIFLDSLYAVPEPKWFGFQFVYTLSVFVAIYAIEILKKHIRFYNN